MCIRDRPDHILYILQEGGFDTLGDLVLQMRVDPDRILALNGIGPKSFEQITELTDNLRVEPVSYTHLDVYKRQSLAHGFDMC